MDSSLVQDALDLNLLFSPLALTLIRNFSFKDEILSFCSSLPHLKSSIISWREIKSFFESNNWNWNAFIQSNLHTILLEKGFLLSSSIDPTSIPLDDFDLFLDILTHFVSSKTVFDSEMLAFLKNKLSSESNESESSSSTVTTSSPLVESNFISNNVQPPSTDSLLYKTVINDSITLSTINLSKIHEDLSLSTFQHYFASRFRQLDSLLQGNNQDPNQPSYPSSNKEIELNQRIFITGVVTQTSLTSTQLYSTKIQLENPSLNCTIIASISIQQQSKIPFGVLLGLVGKVIDIEYLNDDKTQVSISAEDWFFPGITAPDKKTIPKNTNESWAVIIGSINFSQTTYSLNLLTRLIKWLQTIHDNFRISYTLFIGGILSNKNDFCSFSTIYSASFSMSESFRSDYDSFNSFIEKIPSNIHTFIVPSSGDITNHFLPQPALADNYRSSYDNIHYLQNPHVITLEGKNIFLYNPFQYFSHESFLHQPEKFGIELLNFRHVCPIWDESQNVAFPYSFDSLVIPDNIDFFVFNHPTNSVLSNYKNINLLSVPINDGSNLEDFSVLIFNLHTQERKVISIPLNS